MKALIIGGGGFVGPYLVNHLHDDLGYDSSPFQMQSSMIVIF